MYSIYLEPILENCSNEYKNVLTINKLPNGPLSNLVTQVNTKKLSSFKSYNSPCNCKYIFHKIDSQFYMDEDDILDLFSFCIENGYTINKDITKILNTANIVTDNKRLICIIVREPAIPLI